MTNPSDPIADPKRIAALRRAGLLDSPPEEPFDRLTSAASTAMDAVALVSLVAQDRQYLKSARDPAGVFRAESEQELAFSLCRYAVAAAQPLLISDARQSPDFRDHPAVVNGHVVAYAGFPIFVDGGEAIGTVCVLDNKPREWGEEQLAALRELAREASDLIARQAVTADGKARLFAAKAGLSTMSGAAGDGGTPPSAGMAALLGRMESLAHPAAAPSTAAEAESSLAAAMLFFLKQLDAYVLALDRQVPNGNAEGENRLRAAVVTAQAGLVRAVEAFDTAAAQPSRLDEAAKALRDSCAAFLEAEERRMRSSLLFRRGETSLEDVERCVSDASAAEHAMRLALREYTLGRN